MVLDYLTSGIGNLYISTIQYNNIILDHNIKYRAGSTSLVRTDSNFTKVLLISYDPKSIKYYVY